MNNRLPINWSFAGMALLFIVLAGSILYFAQNVSQNRQSATSQAAVLSNDCVNGIQTVTILKDGQPLTDGIVINDLNNLSCKIHVQGVTRADTALVCAFQVGSQAWVIGCPNSPGDFVQEAPPGQSLTGDDVTTTFTKCSQGLLNPPQGYHSPQPGEAIQARAIRRVFSCTTDAPPIPWEQQGYYATGTNFSLQTALPSQNPTTQPTNQPTIQPTATPTEPSQPNNPQVCSGNSCNDCILNNRKDILPYYRDKGGWDISCSNQTNIVNNWCGIDPTGCNNVKSNECASVCQTPPISCPRGNMGNLNCDSQGCINNEDLTIFRTYFGKPGAVGNFFNDVSTIIDTADYEILRQNFGTCSLN